METQIIENAATENSNFKPNFTGGLLASGETIGSYRVDSKLPVDSGEAEIYICVKDNEKYVLKYYFNCKPKTEVIEKLKSFNNPDIVSLYEYGYYKDHFYEVLEYAEGGALDSRSVNGKFKYLPVSEESAIQIVKETINAFNECHKAGIIHRDIKPGNLFYKNKDGSDILVGDFGISSFYDVDDGMSKHLTQTSARTEGYTAPEVYTGLIGPEIDYYSLGVTLWELLTAKEPFMTVDEKPMFPAAIIHETTQGKMVEILLARAPQLSTKMKTLIRGLMTMRHEKRWNYEKVTRFLNGEDIPVFAEVNQIPSVMIGETECSSFKEIAVAILKQKEIGKDFVYKGNLARYLVKIDRKLANEIADLIDEYSAKDSLEEGLFCIAYRLCPNFEFKLSEKTSISSISEILKILETKPEEILPFLTDESKNLYTYLKVIGFEEPAKKIFQIVTTSKDDYLLIPKIELTFNGNTISPFHDGINDNVVLSDIRQVDNLSDGLKNRLLLKIDANDNTICAWFENHTGKNIKEWRTLFSDLPYPKDVMAITKWDFFKSFIDDKYFLPFDKIDKSKLIENLRLFQSQNNYRLVNFIIDKSNSYYFDNSQYETCAEILNFITDKTECLSQKLTFYINRFGVCLYELAEYKNAILLFKMAQKQEPDNFDASKYLALCYFRMNDFDTASDFMNKAIAQKADDALCLNLKGMILARVRKYKEAVASFTMALEINECKESYLFRAGCYEELAKDGAPELKKKAEEDRERAERIESHKLLKDLYENFEKNKREQERRKQEELEKKMCLNLVSIKYSEGDFCIGKTPVTQKLYKIVMGKNPSRIKGDNNPVERVSWDDAIYFCNKLSEMWGITPVYSVDGITDVEKWDYVPHEGNSIEKEVSQNISADGFRLPTEEEWEYAAKGGENYEYSGSDNLDEVGWYGKNSGEKTHPVAQKKPNGYGLYDMSGNVQEWCWDRYLRGGSWNCYDFDDWSRYCEVDYRNDYDGADDRYGSRGFRLARTSK